MRPSTALVLACLFVTGTAAADSLTLKEAVSRALQHAPELRITLAQQEKAHQSYREARAQYIPTVTVGSGLAATRGFPMALEGAAPSVFQVVSSSTLFNRSQRAAVDEARIMWRAAEHGAGQRADDIAWKTASAYLELNKLQRSVEFARKEMEASERMREAVEAQVTEGRAIPLEGIKARLAVARQRQLLGQIEGQTAALEAMLRGLTGMPSEQRIETVDTTVPIPPERLPAAGMEAAVERALQTSAELKRLATEVEARQAGVRSAKMLRWPQLDLIGQYAVLSRLNNYEDFFRRFERHNLELGVSARFTVFDGKRIDARVGQAEADLMQARAALEAARNDLAVNLRQSWQQLQQFRQTAEIAKLELDVARESLNVTLARFQEGRAAAPELDQARAEESGKWLSYLDAHYGVERAQLDLLRQTGDLAAALR